MWLDERVYNQREAELKDRVDRRRLRIVHAAEGEASRFLPELETFRSQMANLGRAVGEVEAESGIVIDTLCDPPVISVVADPASTDLGSGDST